MRNKLRVIGSGILLIALIFGVVYVVVIIGIMFENIPQ